ncbi:MAG: hypothetical protein ACF8LK_03330 [Phycisphaerales bacterium JB041]
MLSRTFAVAAGLVASVASVAFGQLQLTPESYVFFLQDTADRGYYLRAFDSGGDLYAEVQFDVGVLPTYTGFATVGNRIFAVTYPDPHQLLVEFDSTTGELIAEHEINEPEIIIGLDSDQTNLFLNGFNEWTGEMTTSGQFLGSIDKPSSFGGGGALAIYDGSFYYYDESSHEIVEADRDGNVLDTIDMSGFRIIPDCLDYDPASDEFLLSGHGRVWRYDRQGQLLSELALTGFGSSFHVGFEYHPVPIPAPGGLAGMMLLPLGFGRRPRR